MQRDTPSRRSLTALLALAATGLGVEACGGDSLSSAPTFDGAGGTAATSTILSSTAASGAGGAGGGTGSRGISGSVGTSTTAGVGGAGSATSSSSSSSAGGGTSSASAGAGGGAACTEITLAVLKPVFADGTYAWYSAVVAPNLGDPLVLDKLLIEFYGSSVNHVYNGEQAGTFDLAAAVDSNYATCSRCLMLYEDQAGTPRYFFQQSGSLTVQATSKPVDGTLTATIDNLTLIEVTLDAASFSTPVPDGGCRHLTTATLAPPIVPAEWRCDPTYYADALCDCGCGVVDFDCEDAAVGGCQFCNDAGSCSVGACPGTIAPKNSAICTP